jgi:MoaA/NifB/PqqE/SkfB family radical SAM enzyme
LTIYDSLLETIRLRTRNFLAEIGSPGLFQIELTGRCNINCAMCARSTGLTRPTVHMDLDLFKEIVDQSAHYKMPIGWFHHFGETMMYPHLREALAYFKEKGVGTGAVSTNAILLNENKRDILLENARYVLCCMDTMDEDAYLNIRNNPYYSRVRDNIADLISERDKRGSDCRIGVQFLRTSYNRNEEISSMMDFFGKHESLTFIEKGTVKHPRGRDVSIYASSNRVDGRVGCSLMHTQLCVLCTGECVPCCWDANGEQVIGDIRKQSLKEIWQGQVHKKMQRDVDAGDFGGLPLCTKCAGPGEGDDARVVEQVNIYVEEWKSSGIPVVLAPDGNDMYRLIDQSRLRELSPYILLDEQSDRAKPVRGLRTLRADEIAGLKGGVVLIYSQQMGTETYFRLRHLRDQGINVVVIGSFLP